MTALAVIHKAEILNQLAQGKLLREIAPQFGITKQAISAALRGDPDYHAAQKEQADSLVEIAKEETFAARDPIDIARAREISKFAFRYAESIDPDRWAPSSKVSIKNQPLSDEDANLLSSANELLALFKAKREKVVEAADCAIAAIEEKP